IDYQVYEFGKRKLRGPRTSNPKYIAYLGAAQTFGRYCPNPFPNILGERLQIGTLNLGKGGAGPTYFLNSPHSQTMLEAVDRAQLVVVQVMSGRSISNSVFQSLIGCNNGFRLPDGKQMKSLMIWNKLLKGKDKRGLEFQFLKDLIEETRQNHVNATIELLKRISPPKILLWFSVRSPQQLQELSQYSLAMSRRLLGGGLSSRILHRMGIGNNTMDIHLGEFPHLIDRSMVDEIKKYSDSYVECVTRANMPQQLVNFQGDAIGQNIYYPSPEMHERAAEQLLPVCKRMLEIHQSPTRN
ncbi:MAG: DUF6473 family protein, partial [Cyanobacteriota bacterium]|nr:DUF6473 family protein [Cyanobacteriota bacterium]